MEAPKTSCAFIPNVGKSEELPTDAVVTVDVNQAYDLVKSGYKYLDVRTPEEFNKGHADVEKVLNIPYKFNTSEGRVNNPMFLGQVTSACSKDDNLVVACQSGVRSLGASAELLKADFKNVRNMGGGFTAWVSNGLPVKKPKEEL